MKWNIAVAAALAAVVFCVILAVNKWLLRRMTAKKLSRLQNDLISRHYDEVENMYRQVRGWRHDYHNHIQMMKAYLAQGEYERLDHYLDQLTADLSAVDTVIKTGNVMVDAILNSKISMAKSREIAVNAKAIVPKEFECSEMEICMIIGNLMDNAAEACMKLANPADRFIRIYLDVLKGKFYLCITNSMDEAVLKKQGKYLTTKSGKEHGLGLTRVDEIVKKYGGCVNRQHEDGVFSTEIILPIHIT